MTSSALSYALDQNPRHPPGMVIELVVFDASGDVYEDESSLGMDFVILSMSDDVCDDCVFLGPHGDSLYADFCVCVFRYDHRYV